MEHVKTIMEEMGYIRKEEAVNPKPTWQNLLLLSTWDTLMMSLRWVIIFGIGILAVNILAQTLVLFFLKEAPSVCSILAIHPV